MSHISHWTADGSVGLDREHLLGVGDDSAYRGGKLVHVRDRRASGDQPLGMSRATPLRPWAGRRARGAERERARRG